MGTYVDGRAWRAGRKLGFTRMFKGYLYGVAASAVLLMLAASGALAANNLPLEAAKLAPHRAVYDLELSGTRGASTVAAVDGRLVFELTGSPCEGFTQNMRFVMNVSNRDGGATLSDLRSSTWEASDGGKYRFSYNDSQNQEAGDETIGDAEREADQGVAVRLAKPASAKLTLSPGTLFPVQHTIHLLAAALRGDHLMAADLYDGSDKGGKNAFFTNSIIGPLQPSGGAKDLAAVKNAQRLEGLKSWPVTIAYYSSGSDKGEGIPEHEMSFVFYENGVIRNLGLDYGSLTVRGKLSSIEFYEPEKCPQ